MAGQFDRCRAGEQRRERGLQLDSGQRSADATLLDKIDFASATTLCDVGGANGTLCGLAAQRYPNLSATVFDLPPVVPVAQRHLEAMGVGARVNVVGGDFFADDLPKADIIVMGNILHDWDEGQKKTLIAKAHRALNDGGRFMAIENVDLNSHD